MMDTPWMKGTIDYLATEELIKPLYRKGIVSWTSLGNEKQAAAIISDYKQILTESIFDAGDVGPGLTLANERLQRLYGVSEFSADGKDVLMHLPPEKFYPDDGTGSHDYIWKQLNEEFARDGIKHGKIFLYADRDTEIDIAAGKRPHYQVQFVNEKGELEHYRKPFFANPPTADEIKAAGDAALDKKIAEGEAENRKEEQERLQDKLFSRILMHTITDPLTWLLPKPAP